MSKMLGKVMDECQHALVKGRQIWDAVLMANKVADDLLHQRREGVLCKLNMEKTYDNINWNFVDYMLRMMSSGDM